MSFLRNPANIAGLGLIIAFFLSWGDLPFFGPWSGYALATNASGTLLKPLAPLVPLGGILAIGIAPAWRRVRMLTRIVVGLIPFGILVVACLEDGLGLLRYLGVGAYVGFVSGGLLIVCGLTREADSGADEAS